MTIRIDSNTGDIKEVRAEGFKTSGQPNRDEEGICYVPQTNTVFLSSESDKQIIEYSLDGQLTGRRLNIPQLLNLTYDNRSFEALTYNAATQRFWTTTENTLKADGMMPGIKCKIANMVRLQSFNNNLQPCDTAIVACLHRLVEVTLFVQYYLLCCGLHRDSQQEARE